MFIFQLFLFYLSVGAIVSVAFAFFGAPRLLPGAKLSVGARLLLMPGAFLLWPLLAKRWVSLNGRLGVSVSTAKGPHR